MKTAAIHGVFVRREFSVCTKHLEVISSLFSDPSGLKRGAGWDKDKAKEIKLGEQKAFGTFSSTNHPMLYLLSWLRLLLPARIHLKIKIQT